MGPSKVNLVSHEAVLNRKAFGERNCGDATGAWYIYTVRFGHRTTSSQPQVCWRERTTEREREREREREQMLM